MTSTPSPTPSSALADLVALVKAVGHGFHPDTRGEDYAHLPVGITAERYEEIVEAAFAATAAEGFDVYTVALDTLHAISNAREADYTATRLHNRGDAISLPYASAGYADGQATATCPDCGLVCSGSTPKAAARSYARHYEAAAKAGQ